MAVTVLGEFILIGAVGVGAAESPLQVWNAYLPPKVPMKSCRGYEGGTEKVAGESASYQPEPVGDPNAELTVR